MMSSCMADAIVPKYGRFMATGVTFFRPLKGDHEQSIRMGLTLTNGFAQNVVQSCVETSRLKSGALKVEVVYKIFTLETGFL
jgi:hypothetical protein